MDTDYGVDSIHINVGQGDSAIHLLIKNPGYTKPTIMHATLIDGGPKTGCGFASIKNAITKIQNKYDFNDETSLKFDSVVVTHWDADHFEGVIRLIESDIEDQLTGNLNLVDLANLQCRYFKYKGVGRKNPLTTFYAPYWGVNDRFQECLKESTKGLMDFMVPLEKKPKEKPGEKKVGVAGRGKHRQGGKRRGKNGGGKDVEELWLDGLCKLIYKPGKILGVNFLTNEELNIGMEDGYEDVTSPEVLIENTKCDFPVGIYCVCSRGAVLGSTSKPLKTPVGRQVNVKVIDEKNSKKNQNSVGAIVLWRNTERISHYFAGDAMFETERMITDWICKGKQSIVTSMKFSHHGAASSTPTDMIERLRPTNMIVSAGSKNAHPRWELIFYINAWLLSLPGSEAAARSIYATRYPYYFEKYSPVSGVSMFFPHNYKFLAFVPGEDPDKRYTEFVKKLQDIYNVINAAVRSVTPNFRGAKDIKTQFDDWLSRLPKRPKPKSPGAYDWEYNVRAWINHQVESAWPSLSRMYDPADQQRSRTDYITVRSRSEAASTAVDRDGRVTVEFPSGRQDYMQPTMRPAINSMRATDPLGLNPGPAPLYSNIHDTHLRQLQIRQVMPEMTKGSTPRPTRKSRGGLTARDSGYYIVYSKIKSTDRNVLQLADGTPLNSFVAALHSQKLSLATKPAISASTAFLPTDELSLWLTDAISATSLTAKTDDEGHVNGFMLETDWPNCEATNRKTIKFDTNNIVPAFNLPGTNPPIGLLGNTDIIVFGLDNTQDLKLETDLGGALKYAGLGHLVSSPLIAALGTGISLTLSSEPKNSTGSRNAVWFEPRKAYRTTVRLQWNIDDEEKIKEYINFFKGHFDLESVHLITRRTSTWTMNPTGVSVVTHGEAIISAKFLIEGVEFIGALTFSEDSVQLELTTNEKVLEKIIDWIAKTTGDIPFVSWLLSAGAEVFRKIMLRRISLTVKMVNGQRKITDFVVATEIEMGLGGAVDNPAAVLLTYVGAEGVKTGKLRGELWFVPAAGSTTPPRVFPDWEEARDLSPITLNLSPTLDLAKLHPTGVSNIPRGIPHEITEAFFEVDSAAITVFGKIVCEPPPPGPVPTITLGLVSLDTQYTFGDTDSKGQFDLTLEFEVEIQAPQESKYQSPTTISGFLEYDDGAWRLYGSMSPLYASTLYQFFDSDTRGGMMTFLEALEIHELEVEYNYEKGVASNFRFDGILVLGKLELDLKYKYNTGGWSFKAGVKATTEEHKLKDIIGGITGDPDLLPSFVGDINIDTGGAVSVHCSKMPKEQENVSGPKKPEDFILCFSASVRIGSIKATFVQYRDVGWATTVASKRMFKVSAAGLGPVSMPLVGSLEQPFDEMFYMWVQDKSLQSSTKGLPGLADKEVEYINNALEVKPGERIDELLFKETRQEETRKKTDVVIAAGSHFVLVLKNEGTRAVVIDYTFTVTQKQEKTMGRMLTQGTDGKGERWEGSESEWEMVEGGEEEEKGDIEKVFKALAAGKIFESESSSERDSSMASYKKTVGPISISNIGLQYKNDRLYVLLDAALHLGPIGLTLIGFSIDINLKDVTLQNLPQPKFSLSGLAVSFDQPPIKIAGMYTRATKGQTDYFVGGVIVSFAPYLFQAAGFYGTTKKPYPFTSAFVFGSLEGPLANFGFAEVSGITGGFGYNTDLRFPAVKQVPEFPFIAGTAVGSDVMETLQNLVTPDTGGWFDPRNGSFWLAAGLKVTAFETLSIDAVVVVQWNPHVKLGIFGVAVADIPRGSLTKFAHVELGISAVVDFQAGVMKFEAQLSPNSYIFAPSCHLTGGFALYYWFKGASPKLEGDWVFTIGGFHRAFDRPQHYPNPPRLAISWSVDHNISINGEAYFAITPKFCMAGGRLHASLHLGPLDAWFDAYADFLINYKPFHFTADTSVTVSVSCNVDLLITSFKAQAEISAQLHLEGPPLCGRVHIDFWVMAFDIDFGPSLPRIEELSLQKFYKLVLQAGEGSSISSLGLCMVEEAEDEIIDDDKAHVFGCYSGMLEGGDGDQTMKENKAWEVRSGDFSFGISCRFAVGEVNIKPSGEPLISREGDEKPMEGSVSWPTPIYAKPMQLTKGITSKMDISIAKTQSTTASPTGENFQEPEWQIKKILKTVPNDRGQDPREKDHNVSALLDGNDATIQLLMGAEIIAPVPIPSPDEIRKFNAIDAMSQSVSVQGDEPIFRKYDDANQNWSPDKVVDKGNQWKVVRGFWEKPEKGVESRKKTLDLWQKAMFWGEELKGDVPNTLLEKFDNLYLAAPLVSVG